VGGLGVIEEEAKEGGEQDRSLRDCIYKDSKFLFEILVLDLGLST